MKRKSFLLLCVILGWALSPPTHAFDYTGRISAGGFISHEKHQPEPFSTDSNDFATASARFFYSATDILTPGLTFTSDLRDKHDFFNKLDRERQQLTDRNTLQVRQLSVRKEPNRKGVLFEVGRYPIPDAGATFNDGGSIGWQFSSSFRTEVFAGLNPKSYDKSYLEYREKATNFGAALSLQPKSNSWSKRKEFKLAHVTQQYSGETDRQYIFQSSAYQWAAGNVISNMLYLDFVPRTYVQNGLILYSQQWVPKFGTQLTLNTMDVIEYRRRQDLREELPVSPYSDAALRATWSPASNQRWSLLSRYGRRSVDKLERVNFIAECSLPRRFSKNVDMTYRIMQKKEFTKNGTYAGMGVGYFTDQHEFELTADIGAERETAGTKLHPLMTEFVYGFQMSRRFFGSSAIQYQKDEKVTIYSLLFQLTYRFGNQRVAPIRDGAPPRGRL